jgi:hypothetical protein
VDINGFEFGSSNIRPKIPDLMLNYTQKIPVNGKGSCGFSYACHEPAGREIGLGYCTKYYVTVVRTCLSLSNSKIKRHEQMKLPDKVRFFPAYQPVHLTKPHNYPLLEILRALHWTY